MMVVLISLIVGMTGILIAANLKGKPLVDENRYGTEFSETAEEKRRRIKVGLVCGLISTISLGIAVYLLFVLSI
ncbi:hypothetical protein [Planococcus halotolerans]|uniref:Uncharacterized protein n=1 Tax=Planococcus halotolerans TaxID=2233542 RepID=A0A365L1J9_9BACL|nr:hypothetical protein [Planococcus halotolerans]RAZ79308.1 hypothetical protein DP120_06775 [Planococcus halotolerans]